MTRSDKTEYIIIGSLFWGMASSLVVLFFIKLGVSSPYVFALKDGGVFFIALLSIKLWLRDKVTISKLYLILLLLFTLILNLVILNPYYSAPLNNIRQILSPIILLVIFTAFTLSNDQLNRVSRQYSYGIISLFIFGLLESSTNVLVFFDLSEYFRLKGIPVNSFGFSYMFYEPALGYSRRMVSAIFDPISLGHIFATTFAFYYYNDFLEKKFNRLMIFISLAGVILTMSKGAMLQVYIVLFVFNTRLHISVRFVFILIPLAFIDYFLQFKGIQIHLSGIMNAIDSASFFGYGIGSSGNYAKMFGDDLILYTKLGISDTYLGALLGQIGAFLTVCWMLLIFFAVTKSSDFKKYIVSAKILFSIVFVSILSENTMNVTSFLIPAILIGLSSSRSVLNLKSRRLL